MMNRRSKGFCILAATDASTGIDLVLLKPVMPDDKSLSGIQAEQSVAVRAIYRANAGESA
jgi:hypothetical protein